MNYIIFIPRFSKEMCCPNEGHFKHDLQFFLPIFCRDKKMTFDTKVEKLFVGKFPPNFFLFFLLFCVKRGCGLNTIWNETPSRFQLWNKCKGKIMSPELLRMEMPNLANWTTLQQLKHLLWTKLLVTSYFLVTKSMNLIVLLKAFLLRIITGY